MFKKISILSAIFAILLTTTVLAASTEYKLRDINLIATIPDEYKVITRETTASSPNYTFLEVDAIEFTADMEQRNLYLYAVDKDKSFDITISALKTVPGEEYYKDLSSNQLDEIIAHDKKMLTSTPNITVNDIKLFEHNQTPMIMYDVVNGTDTASTKDVYIVEYKTILADNFYSIKLQSFGKEITDEQKQQLKSIVSSLEFTELSGSSTQTRILKESLELLIGAAMVIAVLALIIFILNITKKNKNKHIL